MIAALIIFGIPLALYVLWVYYLAVMNLQRVNDKTPLAGMTRLFALTVFYPGLVLDAIVNVLVMSILLLELPQEWLVTARVSRHALEPGWRGNVARWFCSTLLDPFDPSGCHCKKGD